ncbi:fibronectin type III domain-containing protein [Flavobacterium sp.]
MFKKKLITATTAFAAIIAASCSSSEGTSCPRPKNGSFNVNPTEISVNFEGNEDVNSYKVEVGPTGFTQGSGTSQVTSNTSVSISNLTPSTTYDVYLTSICSAEEQSQPYKMSSITTNASECTGSASLTFFQYTTTSVDLTCSYSTGSTPKKFEVEYGLRGFTLGTGTRITTDEYQRDLDVFGIQPGTNYDFYVRAICWAPTDPSPYTKFEFTSMESCPRPVNLSATLVSGSCNSGTARFIFGWSYPTASPSSYQVSIVTQSNINNPDSGQISIFSGTGADYSGMFCLWKAFYVRANCSDGSNSGWAGPYYIN